MRQRLRLIPRAIVTGNDNGGCTRHEDPGPSHLLREERATSPPVPHAVWLSPPQRFAPVVPRVAHGTPMQDRGSAPTPHAERREYTACSFIYPCPAPAGPRKTAPAPRQRLTQACAPGHPDKSGFHGVVHPASQAGKLDFFLSSTGSPQALSSSSKYGPPARSRVVSALADLD